MKYVIHHKDLLGAEEQQHFFEQEVAKKIKPLEKILSAYSKYPWVEVFISKVNPAIFRVSVSLQLKNKLLYLETKGESPLELIHPLLDKLRNNVKKYLATERRGKLFERKASRTATFAEHTNTLEQLYAENEIKQFNHLIQQLSPALKEYTLRFLKMHGQGRRTNLTLQEILDETYLALFERFDERPADADRQSAWIYKIANETLRKILDQHTEAIADQLDVQTLAAREMKSMEEAFTTDAEGELIMYEELDDVSYRHQKYGVEVLPDDYLLEYFAVTDTETTNFHEQISEVLETCTDLERHVFELYWLNELTEEEIAEATDTEVKEVKAMIESVTQKIVAHLKN